MSAAEVEGPDSRDRSRWRGTPLQERLTFFSQMYIAHSDLVSAGEMISDKSTEIEAIVATLEPGAEFDATVTYGAGVLLIGESGAGKSTFARKLRDANQRRWTESQTYIPAVYMQIPDPATNRNMGVALLKALGHPDLKGTALELRDRGIGLLRKCKTLYLLIDDFQDIPATRRKGIKSIGDWVRKVIDGAPTLVIAMGTPSARVVRDSNDQLQRRMQATVELLPFAASPEHPSFKGSLVRWAKIMSMIDAELPLAERSGLDTPDLSIRLLMGSHARFGHLSKVLKHAVRCAVEAGCEKITLDHLFAAFKKTFGSAADNGNPFSPDYDGEPLTKPGQAFAVVEIE